MFLEEEWCPCQIKCQLYSIQGQWDSASSILPHQPRCDPHHGIQRSPYWAKKPVRWLPRRLLQMFVPSVTGVMFTRFQKPFGMRSCDYAPSFHLLLHANAHADARSQWKGYRGSLHADRPCSKQCGLSLKWRGPVDRIPVICGTFDTHKNCCEERVPVMKGSVHRVASCRSPLTTPAP